MREGEEQDGVGEGNYNEFIMCEKVYFQKKGKNYEWGQYLTFISFLCVYVRACVRASADTLKCQKRMLCHLELKLLELENCPLWVLEPNLDPLQGKYSTTESSLKLDLFMYMCEHFV